MDPTYAQQRPTESARQAADAVRALVEAGELASLARVAEFLTLASPSAALARCQRAEVFGLICNVEPRPDRLPVYIPAEWFPPSVSVRTSSAASRQRRRPCTSAPHSQVQLGGPDQE